MHSTYGWSQLRLKTESELSKGSHCWLFWSIPELTVAEAATLRETGVIAGGMIPKVDCCIQAINQGVQKAIIMDGRVPHSILMELLTDEGAGTMFVGDIA